MNFNNLYCRRCGRVVHRISSDSNQTCDVCGFSPVLPAPKKYWRTPTDNFLSKDAMYLLREELVKTSPEYDEYLFTNRDKIRMQKSAQTDAILSKMKIDSNGHMYYEGSHQPKSKPVVTCPYCKSTNTRKIGTISKAIDVGIFGLFALPKVGKQWRCADCHSEF